MISTPHRGSFFVDHFFETVSLKLFPSFLLLIYMPLNGGSDGSAFNYARPGDMLITVHESNERTLTSNSSLSLILGSHQDIRS
jgi:hypothetical protein